MYSLWFLTATLATGVAVEPPAGVVYAPGPAQEVISPGAAQPEAAPRLRDRVRNLFHRPSETVYSYSSPAVPQGAAPAPVAVPRPASSPYAATLQPATVSPIVHRSLPAGARRAPEDLVGHEHDYSWITGHLCYVRTAGGRWVLRYAPLGQVDRYGGSVVLAPAVEMKNFREGDLVRVHGEVLDEARAVPSLGGSLYRVNAIFMVERSDP